MSELINQTPNTESPKTQPKKIGRYILLSLVIFISAALFYSSSPEKKGNELDQLLVQLEQHKNTLSGQKAFLETAKKELLAAENTVKTKKEMVTVTTKNVNDLTKLVEDAENALCNLRLSLGQPCSNSKAIYIQPSSGQNTMLSGQ